MWWEKINHRLLSEFVFPFANELCFTISLIEMFLIGIIRQVKYQYGHKKMIVYFISDTDDNNVGLFSNQDLVSSQWTIFKTFI